MGIYKSYRLIWKENVIRKVKEMNRMYSEVVGILEINIGE